MTIKHLNLRVLRRKQRLISSRNHSTILLKLIKIQILNLANILIINTHPNLPSCHIPTPNILINIINLRLSQSSPSLLWILSDSSAGLFFAWGDFGDLIVYLVVLDHSVLEVVMLVIYQVAVVLGFLLVLFLRKFGSLLIVYLATLQHAISLHTWAAYFSPWLLARLKSVDR